MHAQACGSTIGATGAPLTGSARLYDLIVLLLSSAAHFRTPQHPLRERAVQSGRRSPKKNAGGHCARLLCSNDGSPVPSYSQSGPLHPRAGLP
jgi:hypothetical protein